MKLNSTQVEQTLSKLDAEVLAEDHPAVVQLTKVFGDPIDRKFWNLNSPFVIARKNAAALLKMKVYFDCGTEDSFGFYRGASELHETRLERVQNVRTRQRMLERLLGVGTVDFDTAAGTAYDFSFRGVDDPRGIVRTVNSALEDIGLTRPHV